MLDFIRVHPENQQIKEAVLNQISAFIDSGTYIQGPLVETFEKNFSRYAQVPHSVSVNSGTDALFLSLKALGIGPGDEVITVSLTFAATVMAIIHTGATPVLIDVNDQLVMDPLQIEMHITDRTKAILPVHYTGKLAPMPAILEIAKAHHLHVIEDAAQAAGAYLNHKFAGSWGDTGCFSFFPTKNLSAMGDGGMITTHSQDIDAHLRLLQNFGRTDRETFSICGYNSRLDALQAFILNEKMNSIDQWNDQRIAIAQRYTTALKDRYIATETQSDERQVYHLYICRTPQKNNKAIAKKAEQYGFDIRIHYQTPLHQQPFLKNHPHRLGSLQNTDKLTQEILTLPCYPSLQTQEQDSLISFLLDERGAK